MFRIDWSNPKVTIGQIEAVVAPNLVGIYDGLIVENGFLYVVTTSPMSSEQEDLIKSVVYNTNLIPQTVSVQSQPSPDAFASKVIGTKKLYKRMTGIQATLTQGSNTVLYTIPYAWVKMTGLQVMNSEALDTVNLYVLDSTTGTYSTIPNYTLNQFGFDVNLTKDYYEYHAEYDADLYQGMQIKIVYTSNSAKTVGFNFVINELK